MVISRLASMLFLGGLAVCEGRGAEDQVAKLEKVVAQQQLRILDLEEEMASLTASRALAECSDSTSWYKNGAPDKDCAWVSQYAERRCIVKGSTGASAQTECALACGECEEDTSCTGFPQEPIVPGMLPGTDRPRIILGIDVDYPPYGTLVYPPEATDTVVGGFGPDVAEALMDVCDIEVTTIQAGWGECWGSGIIGDSLKAGYYHGCETYTHTTGVRNRYLDFSKPILNHNQNAGFLTRLDAEGHPLVSPMSDLSDVTIVDVSGWAPTMDTTALLVNDCVGDYFAIGENIVGSETITGCTGDFCAGANDLSLFGLFDGQADVVYIYSDQAQQYITACEADESTAGVNCALWTQLGQPNGYAYIQTGMPEFAVAGTTLSISKKGSGLPEVLDPCIDALLQTEKYYEICDKWGLTASCFTNEFFPDTGEATETAAYKLATPDQAPGCSDGYCSCSD